MPFCPNCGFQITGPANFCPSCGTRLEPVKRTVSPAPEPVIPADAQYRVILVDKGECTKALCREVLRDMLGYTLTSAGAMIDAVPVVVAQNLTRTQAVTVSEVLSEYGMNISVCDRKDAYVDFGRYATKQVFNSRGALLPEAAAVLRTLSAVNQMDGIVRWSQPDLFSALFRTPVSRPAPQQSALGSIFDLMFPQESKTSTRPKTHAAPPKPGRQHQPVYHGSQSSYTSHSRQSAGTNVVRPASASDTAESVRRNMESKPLVPRPPVRNPGVGSTKESPTQRRHTKPVTGPGTGRRP